MLESRFLYSGAIAIVAITTVTATTPKRILCRGGFQTIKPITQINPRNPPREKVATIPAIKRRAQPKYTHFLSELLEPSIRPRLIGIIVTR